ncbi:YheT family hydrolase [Candidatus Laterigemmans baculatus]|uniref:YheT family hydrolase n=1 Tax=Candidatus Laterigemmans baculatus TaxID=2770505 RepID=UPI0013D94DEE|nr:alpha/beta fold hydrolase [Candidatus Laterigemmans baculatus]
MPNFTPQPFRPHRVFRGGHLQTIAIALRPLTLAHDTEGATRHRVDLPDGDAIVLHDDCPPQWQPGDPSLLLIHGLCGSHAASYMRRLADRFNRRGVRSFRMDMRGCGAAESFARRLTHAGRSEDVLAAIESIAAITGAGPIWAIGVSLGGNQLLKGLGELGAGEASLGAAGERLVRAAAVSPPVDLVRCSNHMQRLWMRPYNRYFIRALFSRIPSQVRASEAFRKIDLTRRPRTLRELDDRITAPLSNFASAEDYYRRSAAANFVANNKIETLVLAAADDPIVPIACFTHAEWPQSTHLEIPRGGGHVAFLARGNTRCWMDECLGDWFA